MSIFVRKYPMTAISIIFVLMQFVLLSLVTSALLTLSLSGRQLLSILTLMVFMDVATTVTAISCYNMLLRRLPYQDIGVKGLGSL